MKHEVHVVAELQVLQRAEQVWQTADEASKNPVRHSQLLVKLLVVVSAQVSHTPPTLHVAHLVGQAVQRPPFW